VTKRKRYKIFWLQVTNLVYTSVYFGFVNSVQNRIPVSLLVSAEKACNDQKIKMLTVDFSVWFVKSLLKFVWYYIINSFSIRVLRLIKP
jgi:hypothetical protein